MSSIFMEKLMKLAQGSTRYNLSKTNFLKVKFLSLEEQNKLGGGRVIMCDERLECIYELIAVQTNLKSSLLTELLSGGIRVKIN